MGVLTKWMTAAQLRLLLVLALKLITDAVQQLDIALIGVLAQRCDECPRHGTRGFAANGCVGTDIC
jgi:hypothetical protein